MFTQVVAQVRHSEIDIPVADGSDHARTYQPQAVLRGIVRVAVEPCRDVSHPRGPRVYCHGREESPVDLRQVEERWLVDEGAHTAAGGEELSRTCARSISVAASRIRQIQ